MIKIHSLKYQQTKETKLILGGNILIMLKKCMNLLQKLIFQKHSYLLNK